MARVCWLFEYPTLCGGERSLLATAAAVKAAGFEIVALAPPDGPLVEALTAHAINVVPFDTRRQRSTPGATAGLPSSALSGQTVHPAGTSNRTVRDALSETPGATAGLPSSARSRPSVDPSLISNVTIRNCLSELLDRLRPDLVHANSLAMSRLSGPVARTLKIPSIGHLRDILRLSRAAIDDLNCHARLLAVSHATRDYHVAQGLDGSKCRVLYNGVDLETFQPRAPSGWLHRELGLDPAAKLIGTIGQLVMRKGQDVLLEAAGHLAARQSNWHLLILGARYSQKAEAIEYERALRRAAQSPPLAGRVHFLGERDDVPRVLNELSLLVHPSRQEPLGRVLLEAGAAGVPIIATDVGGTREIFPPDTRAARLVPAGDPLALADAMAEVLRDTMARERMPLAARRRIGEAFGIHRAAAGLIEHYQLVLNQGDRPPLATSGR